MLNMDPLLAGDDFRLRSLERDGYRYRVRPRLGLGLGLRPGMGMGMGRAGVQAQLYLRSRRPHEECDPTEPPLGPTCQCSVDWLSADSLSALLSRLQLWQANTSPANPYFLLAESDTPPVDPMVRSISAFNLLW